jgi:hypothetical protein
MAEDAPKDDGGTPDGEDNAAAADDLAELKGALKKERRRARDASKRARDLEERYDGIDPDEYRELSKAREDAEAQDAEKRGEWEKLSAKQKDAHDKQLADRDALNGQLRKALYGELIDARAVRELAEQDGSAKLLLPHVRARMDVVEQDGKYRVRVLDANGEPDVNNDGEPMTLKDLVTQMKADATFAPAFASSGAEGTGSPSGGTGGAGTQRKPRSEMTPKEKAGYITEHGREDYLALPA